MFRIKDFMVTNNDDKNDNNDNNNNNNNDKNNNNNDSNSNNILFIKSLTQYGLTYSRLMKIYACSIY